MPTPTAGGITTAGQVTGRRIDCRLTPRAVTRSRYPPRLGPSDLIYVGAFKVPSGTFGIDTFDSAFGRLAGNVYYDGATPTLWIGGQKPDGGDGTLSLAQISIPTILDPHVVGLAGLNTATVLQGFADPSDGRSPLVGNPNPQGTAGYLIYQNAIIGVAAIKYDAGADQSTCAYVNTSLDLDGPSAAGPYTLAATDPDYGALPQTLFGSYATLVPPEWRSALGASAVCGNAQWSIISRNSAGPGLYTLDVDTLLTKPSEATPIASTPLCSYWMNPIGHTDEDDPLNRWSLGSYWPNVSGMTWHGAPVPEVTLTDPAAREMPDPITPIGPTWTVPYTDGLNHCLGILFPEGSRSVLFFQRKGLGPGKYGTGTANPALDGLPVGDGSVYCYDPDVIDEKGEHSYPYTYFVSAYDVLDYVAVTQGLRNPWEVRPYAGWTLDQLYRGPGVTMGRELGGVAWDPVTRRAYVGARNGDAANPLIHVLDVMT